MSKAPSSGITTALTKFAARQGFLVRIIFTDSTLAAPHIAYLTSFDDGFNFVIDGAAVIFQPADITLTGLGWQGSGSPSPSLSIGDAQRQWWAYAIQGVLVDALVDVWLAYADAPYEAEPLLRARIGKPKKGQMTLDCALVAEGGLKSSPRRRVQNIIPAQFLLAEGATIVIGGETWVLDRQ